MKELLIIKAGDRYLRFLPEGHRHCSFDKASVFPLDRLGQVRELMQRAREAGVADIELRKLTIIEEPYLEDV